MSNSDLLELNCSIERLQKMILDAKQVSSSIYVSRYDTLDRKIQQAIKFEISTTGNFLKYALKQLNSLRNKLGE